MANSTARWMNSTVKSKAPRMPPADAATCAESGHRMARESNRRLQQNATLCNNVCAGVVDTRQVAAMQRDTFWVPHAVQHELLHFVAFCCTPGSRRGQM